MDVGNKTNGSFGRPVFHISKTGVIVEVTVLAVLCVFGTVGNLLTFTATFRSKKLQSAIHLVQRCSMVVDLFICSVLLPLLMYGATTDKWRLPALICTIFGASLMTSFALTLNMHVISAINRMCGCFPANKICKTLSSKKGVVILIAFFAVYDFVALSPVYIGYMKMDFVLALGTCIISSKKNPPHVKKPYFFTFLVLMVYASVILTAAMYCGILKKLYKQSQNLNRRKTFIEATKNMFILYVLFLVCWLPDAMHIFINNGFKSPAWLARMTYYTVFCYSALNPVIYFWKIPGYKQTILQIFGIFPNRVPPAGSNQDDHSSRTQADINTRRSNLFTVSTNLSTATNSQTEPPKVEI